MKIRKILKRCTAAMLAAAIGMTTLAANVSAATSGVSIGYTWNSSVNPTIKNRKNGVTGGVSGQYIKAGEQICRFSPSSTSDWAFCIEPAKSMQGASYKDWYTQNGFTKYDTFDLSDKNKADSFAYWKSIGGTDGPMAKYLGLVQYYRHRKLFCRLMTRNLRLRPEDRTLLEKAFLKCLLKEMSEGYA